MGLTAKMRIAAALCGCVLLVATGVQAEMVIVDDFESYQVGESIHLQGLDDLGWGDPAPRWYAQRNSSVLGDHGWATVECVDGDGVLQLINRDAGSEIDTVYVSMSITEYAIEDMGTIYMRFKADGPNDVIFCTNDLAPGYDYDGSGTTSVGDGFQGTTNYSEQMSMCRLSGAEDFHARNGGAYEDVDMGQQANVWQELWIQYDNLLSQAKYYVCPEGGTPQQVMSTSGDWWGDRNTAGDGVYNLKFFVGMYPWPEANIETTVYIDLIAINTAEMTLERFPRLPCVVAELPGDLNGDGTVDLDDFVIFKHSFGIPDGWRIGDLNCDGKLDLEDFVIFKNNFGKTINYLD